MLACSLRNDDSRRTREDRTFVGGWGPLSWVRCGVALRVVGLDRSARAMWLVWAPGWGEGWWSVGGRAAGQAGRGPARRVLPVTGPLGDGGGWGGFFLHVARFTSSEVH